MNLLTSAWIPVIRRSGRSDTIAPFQIAEAEDPPVSLAWPRPDWNAACAEFLVGLLYAACPPTDRAEWRKRRESPDPQWLSAALNRFARWFELDGPGGQRAFQSMEEIDGDDLPISRLLIDAPGENTEEKNADLFVKRQDMPAMSPQFAAIALLTFQSFAPSGGSGHRTSLRGGGPMVTLVDPAPDSTLYDFVWANVPCGEGWPEDAPIGDLLSWVRPTFTSEREGTEIHEPERHDGTPHPACFFATPRRIILIHGKVPAECTFSRRTVDDPVVAFRMVKYGHNYGLWRHPCTPYYRTKPGEALLAVHPKPGRFGYRHYVGVLLKKEDSDLRLPAHCVSEFALRRDRGDRSPVRLFVSGWAMSTMTAIAFVESRHPLPAWTAPHAEQSAVDAVEAADLVCRELVWQVQKSLRLASADKGIASRVRESFYAETESAFDQLLTQLDGQDPQTPLTHWHRALETTAYQLFNRETEALLAAGDPDRIRLIAEAGRQLMWTLRGFSTSGKAVFGLLRIQPPEPASGKRTKGGSKAKAVT